MRCIRALAALVVLCVSLPVFASDAKGHETASFRDGLLSVDFDAMPVGTALLHLERTAGVSIAVPTSALDGTITMKLEDLTVERGVGMVLRAAALSSYAVLYDGESKAPKAFVVLDSDSGVMPSVLTDAETERSTEPAASRSPRTTTVSSERLLARLVTNNATPEASRGQ